MSTGSEFAIKDSGARQEFGGGMVRDTTEGKVNFLNVRFGPMLRRWAEHLTKGREKYPDVAPGTPNWTLAVGVEEYLRAKESAERHFDAWVRGDRDEDHAAGVYFNINLAEFILGKTEIDPATGAAAVSGGCDERAPEPERIGLEREGWDVAPSAVVTYTPRPGGCRYFGCKIPGDHEGPHYVD